jgi:hypothetical protein
MKSIKLFFTAALLAVSASGLAQSTSVGTTSTEGTKGWNTLYVQYNPSSLVPEKGDSKSFTGFSIGYNRAFSVSHSTPLYLEAGIGVQYSYYSESETESDLQSRYISTYEDKYSVLSAKIPVSIGYAFRIPNTSISINPYVGIDLRGNMYGKMKDEWTELDSYNDKTEVTSESINLFSKDDWREWYGYPDESEAKMEADASVWKRFQLGWHAGVNFKCDKLLLGVSYGSDFSEIYKNCKIHTTSVTLGYCF